jgi:hypothetical protein
VPAHIKRRALNNACVTRWKNANVGAPKPKLIIITPSWLKVDRAIIFFMSHSVIALIPAIRVVSVAIIINTLLNMGV